MFELEKIKEQITEGLESFRTNKKTVYHTGLLFFSQAVVLIFGFITKGIQTRALTPEGYGLYAFFTALTSFSVLFFNLGLFSSLEVMLATNVDKQKEKELLGTGFVLTFFIGIIFSLFLLGASFFVDGIYRIQFSDALRLAVPLCFALPFRLLIPSLAIGTGKIEKAALYDVLFQLLFSAALAGLFFYSSLTLEEIILLNLSFSILAVIVIMYLFRPSFRNFSARFKEIKFKIKEFGIHYYTGSIFSETTYKLDEILIPYFINTVQLGYYSLANIICSPMVMLSNALSAALFKRFAQEKYISGKIFAFNILWIIISFAVLYSLSGYIIRILFGNQFSGIELYIIPLSISYIFKTLCQPFAFLTAKGKGKEMRNVAVMEGITSIITNFTFIPLWGVMGAVYSSIIARAVDFIGLYYYYRKYVRETEIEERK